MKQKDVLVLASGRDHSCGRVDTPHSEDSQRIADLAFELWLEGSFRDIGPKEALRQAHGQIKGKLRIISRHKNIGLFVASRAGARASVLIPFRGDPENAS
ncbi:MAG: hypothetical protein U0Q18_06385 [Bryobacteraceae bacterium]